MAVAPERLPTRALRVLSVFGDAAHRAEVRHLCEQLAPGSQCLETATVTDAVLALLSGPVDLVLVDLDWAGDLLGGLTLHVRRSAPRARLLGFGPALASLSTSHPSWPGSVHAWPELPQRLRDGVGEWQRGQAAHPPLAPPPGRGA